MVVVLSEIEGIITFRFVVYGEKLNRIYLAIYVTKVHLPFRSHLKKIPKLNVLELE